MIDPLSNSEKSANNEECDWAMSNIIKFNVHEIDLTGTGTLETVFMVLVIYRLYRT